MTINILVIQRRIIKYLFLLYKKTYNDNKYLLLLYKKMYNENKYFCYTRRCIMKYLLYMKVYSRLWDDV